MVCLFSDSSHVVFIFYFIDSEGGKKSRDHVFVEILPAVFSDYKIVTYKEDEIKNLADNYYKHGFSYLLLPAFSTIHYSYAEKCREFNNLNAQALMGWVAGFDLDDTKAQTGFVFNGSTGEKFNDRGIILHVALKSEYDASLKEEDVSELVNDLLKEVE